MCYLRGCWFDRSCVCLVVSLRLFVCPRLLCVRVSARLFFCFCVFVVRSCVRVCELRVGL